MKYFFLVFGSLKRKKVRTLLTCLSIMVAFILFGYLIAVKQAFSQGVDLVGIDRLVIRHKVSIIQFLPESYKDRIEDIEGVDSAVFATWFGGIYQKPTNFFGQMPVDPESFLDMFPEYILTPEEKQAWMSTRAGAIAGRALADRFDWKVGDRIPIQATIWLKKDGSQSWEFDLVGIYDGAERGTDTTQFFFRHDFFQESRQFGSGRVGWYWVRVSDPEQAPEIARRIDEEFANSPAETKTETEGAFVQGFAKQIGNTGVIIMFVLSAVFFTILLVAGNTMAQAVRERTAELAVLKALGFTDNSVLGLVLSESILLATVGGSFGLGIAWFLISRGDPTGGTLPFFYIPAIQLLVGFSLTILLGLVAGLLPALQAQRLQVAQGLRR
ncbi:MAG: FtsX-like permease family protein [Acidobacteria bacterium]|nr:FtsX-like permease family protein [Acidobacteriota bacterium]